MDRIKITFIQFQSLSRDSVYSNVTFVAFPNLSAVFQSLSRDSVYSNRRMIRAAAWGQYSFQSLSRDSVYSNKNDHMELTWPLIVSIPQSG